MYRRLIFDNWVVIFPLVSFITAAVVYATITWRACRMKPAQISHLENLPLADDDAPQSPPASSTLKSKR